MTDSTLFDPQIRNADFSSQAFDPQKGVFPSPRETILSSCNCGSTHSFFPHTPLAYGHSLERVRMMKSSFHSAASHPGALRDRVLHPTARRSPRSGRRPRRWNNGGRSGCRKTKTGKSFFNLLQRVFRSDGWGDTPKQPSPESGSRPRPAYPIGRR